MKRNFILALLPVFVLSACTPADKTVVHNAIEKKYQELKQAMQNGNASLIANNMYTEDAVLYQSSGQVSDGRAAIERSFAGMINSGVVIECHPKEVEVSGDMAYEIGLASIQDKEGKERRNTRYMVIWKEKDGDWKMHRDFVQGVSNSQ